MASADWASGTARTLQRQAYAMNASVPRFQRLLVALLLATAFEAGSLAAGESSSELRLPPDAIYSGAATSPGPVVFSHKTHVPLTDDRCVACHPALFAILFLLEMGVGVVLPVGLLLVERVRTNPTGLVVSALFAVLGFVMNRLNVSVTGMEGAAGVQYVPSWMEVTVSLGLVALGFERLDLFLVRDLGVAGGLRRLPLQLFDLGVHVAQELLA